MVSTMRLLFDLCLITAEAVRRPDDFTPYQGGKHESPSQGVKQARVAAKDG